MENIFKGIFDSEGVTLISVTDFLLCLGVSLLLGVIMSLSYMLGKKYTRSFLFALSLLPSVVCVVIMMVNGNVGTGVAVAGAFSLVRFRSAPGTAKEICALFVAMGAGLVAGMGYLGYAFLFTIVLCLMFAIYNILSAKVSCTRVLSVTIPEDLNYTSIFDEVFSRYLSRYELTRVKTTNMGSLFRLTYNITLKESKSERELINEIRVRNGNLEVSVMNAEEGECEL